MEMHQVRYFVALTETLNFTRAAERCNVSQPSLTRAIKLLEDELGGPLFNRERNQTHLTELGRLMEPHLREVLSQTRTARQRAGAFFQLRSARLRLGVTRGVPLAALDDLIQRYLTSWPDTELELCDERPRDLQDALRRGDFEVVVLPQRATEIDDLHYYALAEEPMQVLARADHRFAALGAVPLGEIARETVVCFDACPFWAALERQLGEQGATVRPRVVAGSVAWMLELIAAGVGVGVGSTWQALPGGIVGRPIEGVAAVRELELATKRGRLYSPPVKAFVEIALRPRRRQPGPASPAAA